MDEDTADDAMREMMGFGTFGSNKRQKLNSGSNSSQRRPVATSSNNTPLGKRPDPDTMNPAASVFKMVPASLPPSGRSSKSPTPEAPQQPQPTTEPLPLRQQLPNTETQVASEVDLDSDDDGPSILSGLAKLIAPPAAKTPVYSSNDIRSDPNYSTLTRDSTNPRNNRSNAYFASKADKDAYDNEVAWTSPYTGAQLTRKELAEYAKGKEVIREEGSKDVVFFKPGFIEENPWAKLEAQRGIV